MDKHYCKVIVDKQDFEELLWAKNVHSKREPLNKRWYESQERFEARFSAWSFVNREYIEKILDLYKRDLPDMYHWYSLVDFGYTKGHDKTFYLYLTKYEMPEEYYEEHA